MNPIPHRPLPLFLLACAALSGGTLAAQGTDTPPPFTETIEVREVEVLFDTTPLPRFESIGKKGAEDFAAFENGETYGLLSLESTSPADWVHVLYFDPTLAGPEARAEAASALASRASQLVAGGRAEIVIADPHPRILTATSLPEMLARSLSEIAARAREESGSGATPMRSKADRARQLDRLVVELAARGGGGARALWLPVDGWPLAPAELEAWGEARRSNSKLPEAFAAIADAGKALAGYGWVTFPIALRPVSPESSARERERRVQVSAGGGGDERTTVPIFSTTAGKDSPDPVSDAQFATLSDFSLAPMGDLARTTSGALLGVESRLRTELAELVTRRRGTYRAPRPVAGTLLPLEIRWRGGDGRALPAPRFLRSSTPPEVSAARLRSLLAGDAAPAAEAITLHAPKVATLVASRDLCFRSEFEKLPVRISVAREKRTGEIELHVGDVRQLEKDERGICTGLSLPLGAGERRIAWIAENLETEAWTGGIEEAP
ncbi:MAG: hypothetical protein AB7G12_05320 [Thermoanaerobaculia bacterium]